MATMVQSLKELGPLKIGVMGGMFALLVGFFLVLGTGGGSRSTAQMSPLYTQLSAEDSGQIAEFLGANSVAFDVRGNGTQIFVDSDEVMELRLRLASAGIPSSKAGIGYELFDKSESLGSSNFIQNVNLIRALEGELGRTIGSIANVDTARVHLVMPKRELFTRTKREPTASVALKMQGGNRLKGEEIQAIRHLVATSVPGLELKRITIVDDKGRLLARGAEDDSAGEMASDSDEFRSNFEERMKDQLERLLEQTVGLGNVRAQITADIDFDRIVRKSETYDPDGQVARSIQSISELENSRDRDANVNVTVANNLPDPGEAEAGVTSETNIEKTEDTTNFEISKEVINHVQEIGTVNKLSVAILVNGSMTMTEEGERLYTPRTEAELAQLDRLVKSAIGYDVSRGDTVEVVNMEFSEFTGDLFEESEFSWIKQDFSNILQTIILGVVSILAILLVIRPLINKAIETTTMREDEEDIEALMAPQGVAGQLTDQSGIGPDGEMIEGFDEEEDAMVDLKGVQGRVKSSSIKRINDLIDGHPEEALGVLRQWLNTEQ